MIGAIDIGGTKIAVGLVDSTGQVATSAIFPTQPQVGYTAIQMRIVETLRGLMAQQNGALQGIGIGCTGRFAADGTFLWNEFLPGWEGHHLANDLAQAFGVSAAIENDADAAALAEFRWGLGQGCQNFIYVTVSTGIGGGLIFNGQLYRGAAGCHPELGHQVIDPGQATTCWCGATGCWESIASGPALAQWAVANGADPAWDARAVCQAARAGNPLAQAAVQREAHYLGLGLANLVSLFAPQVIALGGGLMQQWDLFEPKVQRVIRQNCKVIVPLEQVRIALAQVEQPALVGAAAVWLHQYGTNCAVG